MYVITQNGLRAKTDKTVVKLTGEVSMFHESGKPYLYGIYHLNSRYTKDSTTLGTYKTKEKAQEAMAELIEAIEYGYRSFRMPEEDK